ncbi:phospho-sugar mutase [Parasporobacterium paucivorans]|uniref:Phosphoglucomutase n=1 Tax=Parasporobacterium paucivorans DSM 15970 TaxID=1122934 RepID=A0A1M6BE83_9FIRM|nr:phospho-sugar mutase [Parasporobacterium paucivorans]SHI47060.1 alpha-phosphoglucomutase [Parasporobacterium paucivorans DSM 15970]
MYKERYQEWLSNPYFDDETKKELLGIRDNEKEIEDRFYRDLEFGTGGLRGIMGAGTNRMNIYIIRKATQGFANYIISQKKATQGVVIAFDSRHCSGQFAMEAALCLNANGIKTYVFESLRPTPVLSYAVRELGCVGGINVTASHNPPEYNGYKVYWEDGAQVTPPHDTAIMSEVESLTDFCAVNTMRLEEAVSKGLYVEIGEELDSRYMGELKKYVLNPECIKENQDKLNIIFTPLHGSGNVPVRRILSEIGFTNVHVVKEQELPDGDFPTVGYPNPEAREAFELALKLAPTYDADLVLATDPDSDRLGAYVLNRKTGEYMALTGNMTGCLLAEYRLGQMKEKGTIPEDGALIKTIVTTNMADAVSDYYGIDLYEELTGFKYIGQKILEFEKTGKGTFLFGFEESYGCLIGDYARDKDAVSAAMAMCEAAAYYKSLGMTLWDALIGMYEKYGYYKDDIVSVTMKGKEGAERISAIMQTLRKNYLQEIGGLRVQAVRDYQSGTRCLTESGETEKLTLPASNVLYYELEESSWVCVRPSGTEPKIKLYFGVKGTSLSDADEKALKLGESIMEICNCAF